MIEIHAQDIVVFTNGWKVATVTKPGVMRVPGPKSEPISQPFNVGDVVLVDAAGKVVVVPLSFERATAIARAVIEGHSRTSSDSRSLLALAAAVIGFAVQTVAPEPTREPPPPTSEQAAAPQAEGISA